MEKIKNIFKKTLLISLSAMLFWIVLNAILNYDVIVYKFNPIILVFGIVLYLCMLIITQKKLIDKISKCKILPYIIFALFFILSLIIGINLRLNPSWDMGSVFNIAKTYAEQGRLEDAYLVSYPNNILLALIYMSMFKFVSLFGVTDFIVVATIFNAIIITLTVILTYYIAKEMFNKEKAMFILLILFFTTPLYLHVAIYYTDSVSMFFSTLILYMFLLIEKQNNRTKKIILEIIIGILIVLSWKIKMTGAFVAIAIIVYRLITKCDKTIIKKYLVIIPTIIVMLVGFNNVFEKRITETENAEYYKMPWEHWIVLGLTGNGGFSQEIYEFTNSFPTYEERKQADINKIKEIINNYNCNDFLKHLTLKLKYAWTDGTYFAPEKLRRQPVSKNVLHKFILADGEYNIYYKYLPQIMHIAMLILIIFSCVKDIKNKCFSNKKLILVISMLGLMVFLMIWENRSRYILTMLPIYILLSIDGIEYLADKIGSKNRKEVKNNE